MARMLLVVYIVVIVDWAAVTYLHISQNGLGSKTFTLRSILEYFIGECAVIS